MKFRGGEFSTGTKGNFQPELTFLRTLSSSDEIQAYTSRKDRA